MIGILNSCRPNTYVLRVEGALRTPVTRVLRDNVRTLVRRGERRIVLDLAAVSRIDAAGVGEVIRAFNMTAAMNCGLRIVNATASVREMFERAHLFDLLSGDRIEKQSTRE